MIASPDKTDASYAPPSLRRRVPFLLSLVILAVSLFALMVVSTYLGAAELSFADVRDAILARIPLIGSHIRPPSEIVDGIVWELRMPRVALAALVGAMLAIAGVAFQGLLRNPLADPYIVGVSSGAAVGGAVATLLGVSGALFGFGAPAIAFLSAMLGMTLVYSLAKRGNQVQVGTFLLAGVAVGSALWSLITLLLIAAHKDFNSILSWLMGSFADCTWGHLAITAPLALIGWLALQWQARALNVFSLGEETAAHLGIEIEQLKRIILIAGSVITAAAVSVCGIIGFVGLIVPHIARRLFGADHRTLYPASAFLGSILVVGADIMARMLLRPIEIPVGVITALMGTPFFIYLLKRTT